MADLATSVHVLPRSPSLAPSQLERRLKSHPSRAGVWIFVLALLAGVGYIGVHIARDLDNVTMTSAWPYLLLGLALFIALGFEFVNGFHDTANAVATVIYTNSLPPHIAVVWSGMCNLAGVLMSSGTVAFAVITLLLRFYGTWARGGSDFPRPVRTPWWVPSSAWGWPASS